MIGPVLVLLVMFLIGPIAIFVVGAIWSAVFGWVVSDDVDLQAAEAQVSES